MKPKHNRFLPSASNLVGALPALALIILPSTAFAQTWGGSGALSGTTNDAAHSWNQNANWTSPATFPNAIGATANVTADFTAATSIFLQQAITVGTLNLNDTGASGDVAITIATGTGTNALIFDASSGNAILTSAGASNTISTGIVLTDSLNVSTTSAVTLGGVITGAGKLTKLTGFGSSLSLNGNSASWAGGIGIQQGTVNAGSFTLGNAVLGTGTVTFENQTTSSGAVALAINSSVSRTYTNNFVQNNANANASGQLAEISVAGGSSGNRVTTFNGDFSTGVSYNANQVLVLRANTNDTAGLAGLNESSLVFGGSWSSFTAGSSASAVRILQGSVVLGATAVANTGGYSIEGNDTAGGSKLILSAASTTMANNLQFAGGANGQRNSFGARHASGTSTLSGSLALSDTDGANVFSQNSGAILNLSGQVSGSNKLRINDGYTFTSADSTTGLQTPTGTVTLSRAAGSTNTGGVDVMNGTLIVSNTSNNGLGTAGTITIGGVGSAFTTQAGAAAANTRLLTGVTTTTAQGLQIGQTITGTNIPGSSVITGITLGSGASNSSLVISNTITSATANVGFTSTAATTAAILQLGNNDASGSLAPASSIAINSGSTFRINRSDAVTQGTHFSTASITGAGGLEQSGSGTTTLNTNGYTGATNVNAGSLVVNGNISTSSLTTVAPGATLGGDGTVGATTFTGTSTHAVGSAATTVGTQTFSSTLTYGSGTIFEWDVSAISTANIGVVADSAIGTYDRVVSTGAVTGGAAIFKVVLGGNVFSDAFWNTNKSWTNIFTGAGAPSLLSNVFSGFDASGGLDSSGTVAGRGQFTFNGSSATLNWTAVPEPTSALVGLLIGAGLLRRRRSA